MHPLSQPSAEHISSGAPGAMLPPRIQPCPSTCLYQITVRVTRPADDKLRYTMPDQHPLADSGTTPPGGQGAPSTWAPRGAQAILRRGASSGRLTHIERMPALPGRPASWQSVGYLAPALTAIGEGGTALYLAPTKALAADQLNLLHFLGGHSGGILGGRPAGAAHAGRGLGLRPAVVDSDTPHHQRAWARQ